MLHEYQPRVALRTSTMRWDTALAAINPMLLLNLGSAVESLDQKPSGVLLAFSQSVDLFHVEYSLNSSKDRLRSLDCDL